MSRKESFAVLIIDNFHMDPEEDYIIDGFPTIELAVEFARRWVTATINLVKVGHFLDVRLR